VFTTHTDKIRENTSGFCDVVNITGKVSSIIQAQKLQRGVVALWVIGSTAALTTIEYEPGLVQDLKTLLDRLVPETAVYRHNERWGDDNGFSHIRASMFGPSLAVPVDNGKAILGQWQQIVLLDFDNRPRSREIIVQTLGDCQ
jgi:secondary thiamine-phosphate synthase enzyme